MLMSLLVTRSHQDVYCRRVRPHRNHRPPPAVQMCDSYS